jgi:hypothetical protein
MVRRLLFTVCILLIAGGIAVAIFGDGDDRADARTSTTGTVVQFHQTGGFAGVDVRMTVRATRRVTVIERGGVAGSHTIRPATLTALRKKLDAAHLEKKLPATPTGCADCFNYEIRYKGHRVSFDDVSIPGRMAKALAELRRIAGGGR